MDKALSHAQTFKGYVGFREGRKDCECDSRSGRPKMTRTPVLVEKVRKLIATDSQLTLTTMEARM